MFVGFLCTAFDAAIVQKSRRRVEGCDRIRIARKSHTYHTTSCKERILIQVHIKTKTHDDVDYL